MSMPYEAALTTGAIGDAMGSVGRVRHRWNCRYAATRRVGGACSCTFDSSPRMTEPLPAAYVEETEMVRRALRRDEAALRELSERLGCVDRMLQVRNLRGGRPLDEHELEDLAQEVRAAVFARLERYRPVAAFSSWVYGFCEFHLRNAVRRKRRQPAATELRELAGEVDREVPFHDHVHAGLARLDELDQRIVRMKHFDGRTLEAIAGELGIKLNTLKSRYFRALNRLRHALSPHLEADA